MLEKLMALEFTPFLISFKLASITTAILFIVSLLLAWNLSQSKSRFKPIFESITALPIVLPPSVLGFYILYALSFHSPIGRFFQDVLGIKLVFNFSGLVVASCFYSLPFMVQPLQSGFESLPKNMLEASYIAGKSKLRTLFCVAMPNIKPSLMTAIVITFAHTVGEFGVVLMIGGNIPDKTRVVSVQIYNHVEALEYTEAHWLAGCLLAFSFTVLFILYSVLKTQPNMQQLK